MTSVLRTAVGGIVFDALGRVLLVRRAHPPAVGSWTLPGGKVRAHESLEHAVTRELLEETSLLVQPDRLVEVVELVGGGFHYLVHDYLCSLLVDPSAARPGDDAAELAWASLDDLPRFAVTDAVVRVVHAASELRRPTSCQSR